MMVMPTPLGPGAKIHLVAPGGAFDVERFEAGVRYLREMGWVPTHDPALFSRHGYLAGTDAQRLAPLRAALEDPDCAALWAVRGGYGATRLVPDLPKASIARAPKWLIGFSDVTALHAQWQRAGCLSIHGANLCTLTQWSDGARAELVRLLRGEIDVTLTGARWQSGRGTGPLVGGNLTVLAAMAGTGYLPSSQGRVVLLEDVGERPYRLDRSLTQLRQAGFFAGAVGVVVGQLTRCGDDDEPNAESVFKERLGDLGVPVLGRVPVGHEPTSRSLVLGAVAEVDAEAGTVRQRGDAAEVPGVA